VVGLIPSNSAAPPGPDTWPAVRRSAARMLSASSRRTSASVSTGSPWSRRGEGRGSGNAAAIAEVVANVALHVAS
jgi:hypothetical protein